MTTPSHTQTPALQRILALLQHHSPRSAAEISQQAFVSLSTLRNGGYLAALCKAGLIHVSGWQRDCHGRTGAAYAFGPPPEKTTAPPAGRNAERLEAILAILQTHGPQTYREVAKHLGLSSIIVKNARYMSLLVDAGRAHIKSWRRSHPGPMQAMYAAGSGRSAPRPRPLSTAERSRRSRQIRRILIAPPPDLGAQLQRLMRHTATARMASPS